ncbi:MAG: hypothetical protein KA271_01765 [Propionivibrio sp.]|nr:hypothetical protein [Propionivibrio sp.]
MNKILVALLTGVFLMATQVYAADPACEAKAAEKKLAGAAKTSFMKKCEKDAAAAGPNAACEAKATEKKLYGAAKNSFVKKCVKDSTPASAK